MVSKSARLFPHEEYDVASRVEFAHVLLRFCTTVSLRDSDVRCHLANPYSLFRPYIKLDLSGADLYPRDTCTFCANEISSIMNTLRAMYGLRRVNLPVINRLLSSLTIHLLDLPSEPSAVHLTQGLQDLQAMSLNHQFAAKCIEIITSLAAKWNIALPESAVSLATRSKGSTQRQLPSLPSSNFWAATIPRKESSDTPSMPMDMTPVDTASGQWPMFNSLFSTATSHPQQNHQQKNLEGMMDGIAFQGWQWQS